MDTVPISGVWLRSRGADVMDVLVERDGKWYRVIREKHIEDGVISHIVEVLGILNAPEDELGK